MKKYFILSLAFFCFYVSCKKDPGLGEVKFIAQFARQSDSIYVDSVATLVMNYLDETEIKDTSDMNSPNVFSHSLTIDIAESQKGNTGINIDYINFTNGHRYYIKKFDFISKSGSVIYYIPYGQMNYYVDNIKYTIPGLPFYFSVSTKSTWLLTIIKK